MQLDEVIQQHKAKFEQLLAELVSFAGVSATGEQIMPTVNFLRQVLTDWLKASVEVYPTAGSPLIVATLSPGKQNTYLFYGHYDVQPIGKRADWKSDPFQLVKKEGRYYGRGVGDNKGQLVAQLAGFYIYQKLYGELPFTVKLVIEGEEESGSPHLNPEVAQLKSRALRSIQAAFVIDGSVNQSGVHVLRLGNRGVVSCRLTVKTFTGNLHSGNFGGVSENAALKLMAIINQLVDLKTGRPKLPALKVKNSQMTPKERAWLAALPDPVAVPATLCCGKFDYYQRLMFQPTVTVNGLTSGYQGPGAKTIIPGQASALIDCRLVAGQDSQAVKNDFENLLAPEIANGKVRIEWLVLQDPSKVVADHPLIPVIQKAIKIATGDCLIEPVMPGSVPNYVWAKTLGVPTFTIPLANYDQHNHAANENLRENAFLNGIKLVTLLCQQLGKAGIERREA